ncbi:MAG: 23S rRNA (guanosine(2251)-2'-O)-methyltransferase RlmB [Firmicutes bacterium]|jgi:23S rRNA (guanosine2251-2'-O)-methyltransferase|nr:23S rRNA (guanosine(2251)-2'-O)-methyltransferase RlmB [Bacillota bacterium]NLL88750.1 23S rRNA (guanosine(2251)-2'-O)-methyltransferase RlmB [Bacillota bacterium]HKM16868.1 23S rRNA (guanosine(2251)-2'-O)-methyltransferase RlmB [Limnochordia bacterium]
MDKQDHTEIVVGRQPVMELFRAGQAINQLYVASGSRHGSIRRILQLAKENNVPVKRVQPHLLDSMSPVKNHQGIAAKVAPVRYYELHDLLAMDKPKFYLVLAGIQDPQNLGSLIRTAEACGVSGVIIPKHRACAVTPAVIRASAGAVSHMPIARVTNLASALGELKDQGCWIVGADMDGEACHTQDLNLPLALVVGGEGRGLPRLVKETCDLLVSIPMHGSIASLNAAVAGGILLYEIARQMHRQ